MKYEAMETLNCNRTQHKLPLGLVSKYHRKVLVGKIAERLKELLLQKARQIEVEIVQIPSLWTRSYYCESIGHISEEAIRRYIEDQRGNRRTTKKVSI